jgi:alpha-L-fucosidase
MFKPTRFGAGTVLAVLLAVTAVSAQRFTLDSMQRRFNDQRFGMFLHFNMNTYVAGWGNARTNPLNFNPTSLNCTQWATAATSAKMKWAMLTCKHHDGFVIWPCKQTPLVTPAYTIAQSSQPNMDVVQSYTTAFRAAGIMPGLYMSGWDVAQGIARDYVTWTAAERTYILGQIRELLSNYGEIPIFWFDGYSWAMGHKVVPWQEIRDTIKAIQPNCVIVETNGMLEPWESDILFVEEPLGNFCPTTNTFAACQAQCIGTDWFWNSSCTDITQLKTVDYIVNQHLTVLNSRYCSFLFDCPPNRTGQLDAAVVQRLQEVGAAWTPPARLRLPAQLPMIESPITPVSATATSGTADNAIDNHNDWTGGPEFQRIWQSNSGLPQSVTIDLGKIYRNIIYLFYLPRREAGNTTGNITGYQINVSTDNATWTQITTGTAIGGGTFGTWAATSEIKKVQFAPQTARYVRLTATAANGATYAVINEVAVGGDATMPVVGVKNPTAVKEALLVPGWSIRTSQRFVYLDQSLAGKMKTVSVYTLGGKLVGTKTIRKNSLDLQKDCGVPEGVYIVKAALVQGE